MFTKRFLGLNLPFIIAIVFGVIAGCWQESTVITVAQTASEVFINLLKLVSLPIIVLSILSTSSGMESIDEIKNLGKKTLKYTLLTTVLAATVALILFILINPVRVHPEIMVQDQQMVIGQQSYFDYLVKSVPSNIIKPFVDNNVIGVMFIAITLSLAVLSLPVDKRKMLHEIFSALFAAVMKVTQWIVKLMPIAIWAFITLFIRDFHEGLEIKSIALYLACVVLANVIQAVLVLPLLLKSKGIATIRTAKGMLPALSVAFFTKSSNAALPMAMRCACENVGVSRKVAGFTMPLCTSINMNGCAAFILTTVLFVAMSNGMIFSTFDMIMWVGIATVAAVGNAGVPMGCYFLSSALLAAMNVPLNILGIILPFYTLIDMLETAINVWSDSCVTTVVNKEVNEQALTETVQLEPILEANTAT